MQVILQGSLRHFPPQELLAFLLGRQSSGTLDLETTGKRIRVFFEKSAILWAESNKDMEPAANARTDGDYALSYIRREGKGRVFYEASGHDESIYAMKNMSLHYLALMQYAMGDLKADDSPSVKAVVKK